MIIDRYVVVREYSHTDRAHLWKVMTRPIRELRDAEVCQETFQQQYPEHKFFIVVVKEAS